MSVRLIRVLEYEFSTPEIAKAHIQNFVVPMTGERVFGQVTIRSATIIDLSSTRIDDER